MVNVAISRLVVAAQALRRLQADLAVALQEFQKLLSIDKVQVAGGGRLSSRFISHAGERRA